jgi:serine/threonine-protein kinase
MRRGASERNVRLSAEAFQKALALDAGYAPAWAGYARALAFLADHAPTAAAARDVKRRALEAADRAIAIDPALADGYAERAFVRDLDIAGAQADIEKALALSPGAARTVMGHGGLLLAQGRVEEAVRALQQASEIDPLHAMPLVILAQGRVALGNLAAARAALDRALEIAPENPFAWSGLGTVWLLQGRPEEALAAFQRSPDDVWRLTGEAQARHAMGQTEEARDALTALVERFGHSAAYQIATVFAWRGDRESAFQWLDRAYQQADGGLVDLKTDPMLRSLRGDPRYADLLRKMKLPVD